jgi:transcriptional regulator with XRE-family HTH domain
MIQQYESAQHMPSAHILKRIAKVLGVTSDDLLAEPMKPVATKRQRASALNTGRKTRAGRRVNGIAAWPGVFVLIAYCKS